MKKFISGNTEYEAMLNKYSMKDGIKALGLYVCAMIMTVLVGISFLTNLSSEILTTIQVLENFTEIFICFIFIKASKESLKTIGLTIKNLKKSIVMGIIGAMLLTLFLALLALVKDSLKINNLMAIQSVIVMLTFAGCALGEEIIYRGYIQTRIFGIVRNRLFGTILNSILFLLIHYPVKWIAFGSISLNVIPIFYAIFLLLLHFLCDYVYRKTNCLWGAIVLHFLFNVLQAMLVIV